MRKVYQNESRFSGLPAAVIFGVGFTAVLFGFIPFAHRIAKPDRGLELVPTSAVNAPPPVEQDTPPPPIEAEKPPEAAPEPQLVETQQEIPLNATIEEVMGTGTGVFEGSGGIRSLTTAETVSEDTFDVAELEKRPQPVSQVAPTYPEALRKAKVEGVVTLIFVLDETGRVEDPRVENSSRPEFEKPALDAIRKWRFSPGEKDGQPVRTYIRVPLRFRVTTG
jgi:protein TonB